MITDTTRYKSWKNPAIIARKELKPYDYDYLKKISRIM